MTALLPCPFCGSSNVDPEGWASTERKGPACDDCAGSADTVERWNTRVLPWQPIETAPKDGTPILITRPTEWQCEEGWHVVRWDDDWWQVHDGKFDCPLRGPDPTHWMPLPVPPHNYDAEMERLHGPDLIRER
jgi:hypothetical protein